MRTRGTVQVMNLVTGVCRSLQESVHMRTRGTVQVMYTPNSDLSEQET
jgi:hypothetical protein